MVFTYFITSVIFSQQTELVPNPFKIDIGVTGRFDKKASISSSGSGDGLYLEPRYAFNKSFAVGLRIEESWENYEDKTIRGIYKPVNLAPYGTLDYYFLRSISNPSKVFAGMGLGINKTTAWLNPTTKLGTSDKFGVMVRTGIEYKHLRVGFEYNYIPKTNYTNANNGFPIFFAIPNSYFTAKVGYLIYKHRPSTAQ